MVTYSTARTDIGRVIGVSNTSIEEILDLNSAKRAWLEQKRWKTSVGTGDGYAFSDLNVCFDERWLELVDQIKSGNYKAGCARWIRMEKRNGGERWIAILPAIERVFHRVLANALKEDAEKVFSDRSFAFRSGRTTGHAVTLLARNMGQNQFLVRGDIRNCFGSIEHAQVMDGLRFVNAPLGVRKLVEIVLSQMKAGPGETWNTGCGLLQGSPLSPLLSNLVLHQFDLAMERAGLEFVRFADDIAVSVKNEREGKRALKQMKDILMSMGLELNHEKCAVLPTQEVEFLGYSFRKTSVGEKLGEGGSMSLSGAWAPAVSSANRVRVIERVEQWCDESRRVGGNLKTLACQVGELYSEWFAYYQTTRDREGFQLAVREMRDVLRREAWERIRGDEEKVNFLKGRGIPEEEALELVNSASESGKIPIKELRKVMPSKRFSRFGLDGSWCLPRSGKKRISYDGRPM